MYCAQAVPKDLDEHPPFVVAKQKKTNKTQHTIAMQFQPFILGQNLSLDRIGQVQELSMEGLRSACMQTGGIKP